MSLGLFLFPIDKFPYNKLNLRRLLIVRPLDLSFEATLSHELGKDEGKKGKFYPITGHESPEGE